MGCADSNIPVPYFSFSLENATRIDAVPNFKTKMSTSKIKMKANTMNF
jgi:hypothetical protein